MFGDGTLTGPGYTVQVPAGFTLAWQAPAFGLFRLLPPGVSPLNIEALLQIRSVQAMELPALLQNLQTFNQPMVAQRNAINLGLTTVLGVLPLRSLPMPQGPACIQEFDAMNLRGLPLRVMVLVIQGPQSAVEVVVMMSLYRWTDFAGPCLAFVGQIQMQGAAQLPAQVQAKVDQGHTDQVEYQLVAPGHAPISLTALPTNVNGTVVIHIDTLIQTGNINGTGIVVGPHSTATVTQGSGQTHEGG